MASGPILAVVAFEAYLILRSVLRMGAGLISKSWGALAIAVLCTTLGYLAMWGAFRGAAWCLWLAASAAFALGPAYQLAAARRATPEE